MKYINKYNNFIAEKLILDKLLLESNIVYSNKLRKALSKLPDNEIAKKLLEIENKDLNIISNYFDIDIDNSTILTFTPDRIVQEILNDNKEYVLFTGRNGGWLTNNIEANGEIFKKLGFEPKTEKVFRPNDNEPGEVISRVTSEKTNKTWCYVKFPSGEGVYNQEKLKPFIKDLGMIIFNKSRQEIRIGRAIRLILSADNITLPNAEIENFVNSLRSVISIMNDAFSRFEIVDGEDLGFWYNKKNYEFPDIGTLGDSCMAVGRNDWLEIYIKNPETVKLLILKSDNTDDKIIGRSLLWKLDDGRIMMDSIYTSRDSDRNIFIEYAKAKNYVVVDYGNKYTAHLKPGIDYDRYPSIDNMRHFNPESGEISNNRFIGSKELYWNNDGDF